ncbi:MAG: helix-turn-helix domain-containing protein [Flammeovirgaceae bacterium]
MIIKQFPDLTWIKEQANSFFERQRSVDGIVLPHRGWPSVILNATTQEAYRPNIRGPISIFMNIRGKSRCGVNGRLVGVAEDDFFLTNQHEYYTLEIESKSPVELFNIHFGEHFTQSLYASLVTKADQLLDFNEEQLHTRPITFQSRLYRRDSIFNQLITALYQNHQAQFDSLLFEEQLTNLLTYLLSKHREELQKILRLPLTKQATKVELYKRLTLVVDYMRTYFSQQLSLDELAQVSCLSKHHFLRLFKVAFGITPHQYILQLRMDKACQLLKNSRLSIQEIAMSVGFEYANSFSRLFKKKIGIYPNAYRNA